MSYIAYSNNMYNHKSTDVHMCKLTIIDPQTESEQTYYLQVNQQSQAVLVQFETGKDGYIVFQDPNISLLDVLAHLGVPQPRLYVAWALETVTTDGPVYRLPLCEVLATNIIT